ncbi:MAG: Asp-tRNA(Asn)/Glu-tRNA(Gln) amidotransferase subunit GatA [Gammaproteobacteria bacterium]|jgi:aspartyl-tRNA(Asn)/glutamyl-tRNA(Gln) amidotransferase subunit A|nr:Asp-tRNA(Asn)/Glu-tRNA(Gln) amidotransferase subunit GatA [Gammaproteobacteria bacterium]MBL6911448.1 Asp-tRNA(Asn)/Glu-tRNA(Gln) amidotransferase subunit GatA [Candidatus Neomarinimicrobiota bacterium]MBT3728012.1 Asp-tRNA(Asn)/Glu-tRNA(Gln) amidotransferase subunit GatA [Candidatus Neomarinimicrobiota bacterium]MBT3944145.1 Asp-tRNA(Asn)/Glu-tRNA(Gln) amidotransferase subunit GatA [Candidatus Neomarinimicrobiota bacterium]MBT4111699.1 Asp-tRNA(Asn)/Glu-tRNA(Gln) amidotransferase subunit Ga
MSPSNALKQKLVSQQGKIANSKTNAIVRTRFDKVSSEISDSSKVLAGKTILVKDNIAIKGEHLTCASNLLESYKSPYSATVIDRLESAGALITGQTNMDEFAMGSSSEYSIYGSVKNPHDLTRVAGGSSGGSAAAAAEGLCDIALGSDTGGSIRQPASFCGIYGLKPTYGRISRYGLVAHASSFDTIGILSKSLTDITSAFSVMSGNDPKDATSCKEKILSLDRYNRDGLPKNIGILSKKLLSDIDSEIVDRYHTALDFLKKNDVNLIEIDLPYFDYCVPAYYVLTMAEASSNLSRFDGVRYGRRVSSEDLSDTYIKSRSEGFSEEVKRRIMTGTYVLSSGYYDAYYSKALKVRRVIKNEYNKLFLKVDCLFIPTTATIAFPLKNHLDDPIKMYLADIFTVPFNLIGTPSLNIPAGTTKDKLPIGFQIAGNSFKEETLFNFAHSLNKAELFK